MISLMRSVETRDERKRKLATLRVIRERTSGLLIVRLCGVDKNQQRLGHGVRIDGNEPVRTFREETCAAVYL